MYILLPRSSNGSPVAAWSTCSLLLLVACQDPGPDVDLDGIPDAIDNCLHVANADQLDTDLDHLGDACDGDADSDGMKDSWELSYGLDPTNPDDAIADADQDGLANGEEYQDGTDPQIANPEPESWPTSWTQAGGNPAHTGYIPLTMDAKTLAVRWEVEHLDNYGAAAISTHQNQAFVTNVYRLSTFNVLSGKLLWERDEMSSSSQVEGAAWSAGTVFEYVYRYGDSVIHAAAESDGSLVFRYTSPDFVSGHTVPYDGNVYMAQAGKLKLLDGGSGDELWAAELGEGSSYQTELIDLAADRRHLYAFPCGEDNALEIRSRTTGQLAQKIALNFGVLNYPVSAPTLGGMDDVLVAFNGRLLRFDLNSGEVSWVVSNNFSGPFAVAHGAIFALNSGVLTARDQLSGAQLWAYEAKNDSLDQSVLVTDSLVFVSSRYHTYAIDLTTHKQVWSLDIGGKLSLSDGTLYISSSEENKVVAVSSADDPDQDGLHTWWELTFGLNPEDSSDAASDQDGDGLTSLEEFTVKTDPTKPDTDDDGLSDGDEAQSLDTDPNDPDSDADDLGDSEEVNQYHTNPLDPDSDGDGLSDLTEVSETHTNPVDADTDHDGLDDAWELQYGLDPLEPEDANADPDQDELTNLEEFAVDTDPNRADTDLDGLSDSSEVNQVFSNPLLPDSDHDIMEDGWEVQYGLNPSSAADADEDSDQDRYTNLQEFWSSSNPTLNDSVPVSHSWSQLQGNAAHTGFVPGLLSVDNFTPRWSVTFDSVNTNNLAVAEGKVFTVSGGIVQALDLSTGELLWSYQIVGAYSISPPVAGTGRVYLAYRDSDHQDRFLSLDAASGKEAFRESIYGLSDTPAAPALYGDSVYLATEEGLLALDAITGSEEWFFELYQNAARTPAADETHVYQYVPGLLLAIDRVSGTVSFRLETDAVDYYYSSESPILSPLQTAVVQHADTLDSFDFRSGTLQWSQTSEYSDHPVLADGIVYAIQDSRLVARSVLDGAVLWRWTPPTGSLLYTPVVTSNMIFVGTGETTYALDLDSRTPVWELDFGGPLAISNDTLFVLSRSSWDYSTTLHAITIGGDQDKDGLPDWWESLYGFDPVTTDNGAADPDQDGLSNLDEYANKTNPAIEDTDQDGSSDGDEVLLYGSDPTESDTDGDQLSDGDEVAFSSDPTDSDSDDDTLGDGPEVQAYGTSPTLADTDQDGMPDGWEVLNVLDPLDAGNANDDSDGDGLTDLQEYTGATNPKNSDTDDDGLNDGEELLTLGTNPLNDDSDGDGMNDGWEETYQLNPLDSQDALQDADNDGHYNADEFYARSDPQDADSIPAPSP